MRGTSDRSPCQATSKTREHELTWSGSRTTSWCLSSSASSLPSDSTLSTVPSSAMLSRWIRSRKVGAAPPLGCTWGSSGGTPGDIASIIEGSIHWLMRPFCRGSQVRLISNLMQHDGREKEKASYGLLTVSSVPESSVYSLIQHFHRKDRILKVTYITFNIFQEGNIFCRYFSRHK